MLANVRPVLSQDGIQRPRELGELLETVVQAYGRTIPGVGAIILFGGITLGEFQPRFSDIDLAVVFQGVSQPPPLDPYRADVPEVVRNALGSIPLAAETRVTAKHVHRTTLKRMRSLDWRAWSIETAGETLRDSPYPFTLCDTWLVHHHGVTLSGLDLISEFPFENAPPTCPAVELAQLKWFVDRIGGLEGLRGFDLLGEIIYYATTFTRAIYTLRTGKVIGRVRSTLWYYNTRGGQTGEYVRLLGQCRCHPDPNTLARLPELLSALWPLFHHYAREALAFAAPELKLPEPPLPQAEFLSWLAAVIPERSAAFPSSRGSG